MKVSVSNSKKKYDANLIAKYEPKHLSTHDLSYSPMNYLFNYIISLPRTDALLIYVELTSLFLFPCLHKSMPVTVHVLVMHR